MSDKDNEVLEATNSDDTQEVELNLDDTIEEDVEAQTKTYSEQEFKQVLARAKKAEALAKSFKTKPAEATSQNTQNSPSQEAIEVTVLKAQGKSNEYIESLKKVAQVTGKSIIEAQSDPIFVTMEKNLEAEQKAEKAKLGASRGSASVKKEKSFNTPGLTESEFKELWKDKMGR